jgi:hypothetical protein
VGTYSCLETHCYGKKMGGVCNRIQQSRTRAEYRGSGGGREGDSDVRIDVLVVDHTAALPYGAAAWAAARASASRRMGLLRAEGHSSLNRDRVCCDPRKRFAFEFGRLS